MAQRADDWVVETARFGLRRWTPDDLEALHAIFGDPEVLFWDERAGDRAWTAQRLEGIQADHRAWDAADIDRVGQLGWFAAVDVQRDEPVANLILRPVPAEVQRDRADLTGDVEIGWHVRRDWWGRSVASETGRALAEHARTVLAAPAVMAMILADNERSQHVAEAIGMTRAGTTTYRELPHDVWRLSFRDRVDGDV